MARIPIITPTADAQPQQAAPMPMDGTRAIGRGLNAVQGGLNDVVNHFDKEARREGVNWAAKRLAEAKAEWMQRAATSETEVEGDPTGYAKRFTADYGEWSKTALSEAPNDYARERLELGLINLGGGVSTRAFAFEATGRVKYRVGLATDAIDKEINTVLTTPDAFADSLKNVKDMLADGGIPGDDRRKLEKDATSRLAAAHVTGLMRTDPRSAYAGLRSGKWDDYLTPSAKAKLLRGATSAAGEAYGADAYRKMVAFKSGEFGKAVKDGKWDTAATMMAPAIIGLESSGRVDAIGPKTKYGRARGLMQLLPSTAEMVAKRLGIPYDEERLRTDGEYNKTLGTAYLGMMLKKYEGDPILAAAAYNAGAGNVDKWIKRFGHPRDVGGVAWASKIPFKETREYILGRAASGKDKGRKGLLARLALGDPSKELAGAAAGGHAFKEAARRGYRAELSADRMAKAVKRDRVMAAVKEHADGGGGYDDLPEGIKSSLSLEEDRSVRNYFAMGKRVKTDDALFMRLMEVGAKAREGDPAAIKELIGMKPLKYRDKLSETDWRRLVAERARVMGAVGKDVNVSYAGIKTDLNVVAPGEFDWKAKTDTAKGKRTVAVYRAMEAEIDAYVARNGKKPDGKERREMARRAVKKVDIEDSMWSDEDKTVFELADDLRESINGGKAFTLDLEGFKPITVTADKVGRIIATMRRDSGAGRRYTPTYMQIIEYIVADAKATAAASARADAMRGTAADAGTFAPDIGATGGTSGGMGDDVGGLIIPGTVDKTMPDFDVSESEWLTDMFGQDQLKPGILRNVKLDSDDIGELMPHILREILAGRSVDFGDGVVLNKATFYKMEAERIKEVGRLSAGTGGTLQVLEYYLEKYGRFDGG